MPIQACIVSLITIERAIKLLITYPTARNGVSIGFKYKIFFDWRSHLEGVYSSSSIEELNDYNNLILLYLILYSLCTLMCPNEKCIQSVYKNVYNA